MTDENSDHAASKITAPAPTTANSLMSGLLLVGLVLILLSIVSNGYLWHLWRQGQIQQARPQFNPELHTLKTQIQALSGDLAQIKNAVELYKAENEAIRDKMKDEIKMLQESQNTYKHQIQKQLQDLQDQSTQSMQNQKRNKITW